MKSMLFFLLFLRLTSIAQSPSWQQVNTQPSVEIKGMVTDTLGFLWMNDEHAIYRFDGIDASKMIAFGDEKVSSLSYSESDEIAIGTSYGRIILFNPYTFTKEVIYEHDASVGITNTLVIDKDNFICLSYGMGIGITTKGEYRHFDIENGLLSNEVYDVVQFREKFYVSTDQGIQVIDPNTKDLLESKLSVEDGLSDMVITQLLVHENELWYSDYDNTIGKLDEYQQPKNYRLPKNSKITSMTSHESELYISTNKGLLLFANQEFSLAYDHGTNLSQLDEEGNLWIVTSNGNLLKGNLYFKKKELPISNIRAIEIFKNAIIVGNESGIYRMINGEYVRVAKENVTSIRSYKNFLLVGTFSEGVKVYNEQFTKVSSLSKWNNIENESVLAIYPFQDEIYISSISGVMAFDFQHAELIVKESLNPIIGQAYIYTMLISDDTMYFGTDRDGISIWKNGHDSIVRLNEFSGGEKIGSVYSITTDAEGKVWFTSSEVGLGYIENDQAVILDYIPNVKDEYTSIQTIHNNNLILIRGSSIDVFNPKTKHLMYFDKELGLASNITYLNTIIIVGEETYFTHDNSIYSYKSVTNAKIHPEVIIDEIRVNLSPIKKEENIFKQNENNIQFDFSGSWLTDPQKLTYQYKLEGFDKQWRDTKDKSISYPKLPSNTYKFRVRASENGLFSDEPEAHFDFQINQYFYNLWWVRCLLLLLGVIITYKLVKQREVRKKEHLELEKITIENQFINLRNQLNPHFLFNSFNTLIGLIEEEDKDRSVVFVEKMSDFYRNMLDHGKQNLISLAQEKEMLSQYIDILKARFNGQLDILLDIGDNPEQYEIPPMTLQLLLENAVKHNVVSTKNPLLVSIQQSENTISVHNRKTALVQHVKSTNTGLDNIKRRFELINLQAPQIMDMRDSFEVIVYLKRKDK